MSFMSSSLFFFNDTATTEIYTLSLHDALPISRAAGKRRVVRIECAPLRPSAGAAEYARSEEHTSELQSHHDLVCRLLLEKKKRKTYDTLSQVDRLRVRRGYNAPIGR